MSKRFMSYYGLLPLFFVTTLSIGCAWSSGEAVNDQSPMDPRKIVITDLPNKSPEIPVGDSPNPKLRTDSESFSTQGGSKGNSKFNNNSDVRVGGLVGDTAPEFVGISKWINSQPLSMGLLRGKVVLVDFWTYTCVNCIRTFPYLKEWHGKYSDKGLIIIGVHTPEFEFEKVTDNVAESVRANQLKWPVAQDNDFNTWSAYGNRFWPAKYLIDEQGVVRYTHFGEGSYLETEEQIRFLLEDSGVNLDGTEMGSDQSLTDPDSLYSQDLVELYDNPITREIYGGFERNANPHGIYVAHAEYYEAPDQTLNYVDPGDHRNHYIYLHGLWINGIEKLKHARETDNYSDYIALNFFAANVNAVIEPEGGLPFDILVTLDDRPLTDLEAGSDLILRGNRSFFTVDEPRMYEVVALPEVGGHELKLKVTSEDMAFFSFTFGAYPGGP